MSEITISPVGRDQYEVVRDRRVRLLSNPSSLDHVRQVVEQQRLPDERVYLTEDDGYRVDITREFDRTRRRARSRV